MKTIILPAFPPKERMNKMKEKEQEASFGISSHFPPPLLHPPTHYPSSRISNSGIQDLVTSSPASNAMDEQEIGTWEGPGHC